MQRQSGQYEKTVQAITENNAGVVRRVIRFQSAEISLLYIKELTDLTALSEHVIKPLIALAGDESIEPAQAVNTVSAYECVVESQIPNMAHHILNGMTVVVFSSSGDYLAINMKKVAKRTVNEPEFTYTMRGPRDAFIENLDVNLSLVRYRIKDERLSIRNLEVGTRTKTRVCVLYLEDVANDVCVSEVLRRIAAIKVDGLSSSGELQAFMLNKKSDFFPQMGILERSDMACGAILEGKVVVIMDGSPWVLAAPKVFAEFLWSCDDHYSNKYFGLFMKILRVLSLNLSFIISSLYVAIVSFHNDVLPSSYIIAIAQTRAKVPFNALIEVLLIEVIGELIRESLVRVPSKIGTAIGIVGAIIIGQAAVSAGIFSPLLLIVISLSLIASFVPSDHTIIDPFRILKFVLILASGTFGFHGFTLVIVLTLAHMVSIDTFGVPYMAPLAPLNWTDVAKTLFYSKSIAPNRPHYLRTKDNTRAPGGKTEK